MSLDSCLVTGGCGFLGHHLVQHLLQDAQCKLVYIVDRQIETNLHQGPTYICLDITDEDAMRALVDEIKPKVIFHTASPIASLPKSRWDEYQNTNVGSTRMLLDVAAQSPTVMAFVFTSTVDIYVKPPHVNVGESHPLWPESDRSNGYNRTKAIADRLVRAANGPSLRTACLRLGHAYGERQAQGLREVLDMCEGDQPLVQLGDGSNLMEVVSADNVARAHVLAAKALVREDREDATTKVGGEAFNISDGAPVPFWYHTKLIWAAARGEEAVNTVTVIPGWIMVVAVVIAEWVFWLVTLDRVKPPNTMSRLAMEYCLLTHTYSIEKAKDRLGFRPVVDHDAVVTRAARMMLEQRATLKKE